MRVLLLVVLVLYFALELSAFSWFAGKFGLAGTLLEMFGSLVVGARILASQPQEMLQALKSQLFVDAPKKTLLSHLRLFLAGFLLVLPGLITDIFGFWLWASAQFQKAPASADSPWSEQGASSDQSFDRAWRGREFDGRRKSSGSLTDENDIVDATIISTNDDKFVTNEDNK